MIWAHVMDKNNVLVFVIGSTDDLFLVNTMFIILTVLTRFNIDDKFLIYLELPTYTRDKLYIGTTDGNILNSSTGYSPFILNRDQNNLYILVRLHIVVDAY